MRYQTRADSQTAIAAAMAQLADVLEQWTTESPRVVAEEYIRGLLLDGWRPCVPPADLPKPRAEVARAETNPTYQQARAALGADHDGSPT